MIVVNTQSAGSTIDFEALYLLADGANTALLIEQFTVCVHGHAELLRNTLELMICLESLRMFRAVGSHPFYSALLTDALIATRSMLVPMELRQGFCLKARNTPLLARIHSRTAAMLAVMTQAEL
jgi:hypothetical protein